MSEWIKLDLSKGTNEGFEDSDIPNGYAAALNNWIPEPTGALRVPRGWLAASSTGFSGTKTARGFEQFTPSAGHRIVAAQASSGTTYKLWYIAKDSIAAGSWTAIEEVTANPSTRPLAMASGAGYLLYCTPEFPSAFIRRWDGTTSSALTDAIAGRFLVYHNNRHFTGGATANPTWLRWCELGDSATWTVENNYQPLGEDDGEPLEDAAIWDRGLFVGKENSIWYVTGFGPDTFGFHRVDGGGVAPGRSLVPTPVGLVAIGRYGVFAFTGGGFERISQPIENSYGMTGNYMSGAFVDNKVYVCDEGSGTIWVWDINTNTWHKENFSDVGEGPGIVWSTAQYLFGGTRVGSTNPMTLYRLIPGSTRQRWAGSGMIFTARTPEMTFRTDEPSGPVTLRNVAIIMRQRDGSAASPNMTVALYTDGALSDTRTIALSTAGTRRHQVSAGFTGYRHQIEFTQTLTSSQSGVCDIEEAWAEVDRERAR